MLAGLFVTPAVPAIQQALASAHADGTLAVIGNAKLATALGTGREVIPVGLSARAAKKLPRTIGDLSSVADRSLSAVVGVDLAIDEHWETTLRGWSRVVRDGGLIIIVDRGHPHEASRRALRDLRQPAAQRHAGRAVITCGLVSHLV